MRKIVLLLILALLAGPVSVSVAQKSGGKKPGQTTSGKSAKKPATTQKKPADASRTGKGASAATPGERNKAGMIEASKVDTFKLQVIPLVKFFESSLNFLADPRNAVSDKQTILSRSYLKWCWDDKVQIEDDLDENRLVPLYKDMPAYLSDVSFFFRSARFTYSVDDVSVEAGQNGLTYFRVTANRNLKGLTVNNDSVNSNKVRYLEMNFDSVKQQMMIVSVYTTKLNEKEDLRNWWNGLTPEWKALLAGDRKLEGTMPLSSVENFNDSVAIIGGKTSFIMGSEFYRYLTEIVKSTRIDLSGQRSLNDVTPLSKLSELREVNLQGTSVSDLTPLRNLNKLEVLDISHTGVTSLDLLRFCSGLRELKLRGTHVNDISVLSSFPSLAALDLGATGVMSLAALAELTGLKDLRIDHTGISDLSPLKSLTGLEMLNLSSTQADNLEPLGGLVKLLVLQCDSTGVSSLDPLRDIPTLQRVYCNQTVIRQKQALAFLKQHPGVQLIYASRELDAWWKGMSSDWQNVFRFYQRFDQQPTSEQLHQLALIDSVNIAGRTAITGLDPLGRLILLRTLQCQSSGISSLAPLKELTELQNLNASTTAVADLGPLSGLNLLEVINLDNTRVASLKPLSGLKKLRLVYADNTLLDIPGVDDFAGDNPACTVVFRTDDLTQWWSKLGPAWKEALRRQLDLTGEPDKIGLHRLAGLQQFSVAENFQIDDLQPLLQLTRLEELQFSGTTVASLAPVARMTRLKALRCQKNPITDLTPVAGLPKLVELDFSNTQVEDLDALQNIMKLEILRFSGTQVKNLKYLQKLSGLRVLEFYNTRVSNIDVLDGMPKLESVKMFNTKVSAKRVEKLKTTHPRCEVVYY